MVFDGFTEIKEKTTEKGKKKKKSKDESLWFSKATKKDNVVWLETDSNTDTKGTWVND